MIPAHVVGETGSAYHVHVGGPALNVGAPILASSRKVNDVAHEYVFKVSFQSQGVRGLAETREVELPVQSTSLKNALMILEGIGEHAKAISKPEVFHRMIEKLKAGCTKIQFESSGTSTVMHFHDLQRNGEFKLDSRSKVTLSDEKLRSIDMLVTHLGGEIRPAEAPDREVHADVTLSRSAHAGLLDTFRRGGTSARVHVTRAGAATVVRGPNPKARHPKEDRAKFDAYLEGIRSLAKAHRQIAFYRGDLGPDFDEATGNDPRTDVFGNFYECAEPFEVDCVYWDGTKEVTEKRQFTNVEAFFQSQRFKSKEAQDMFQGLSGEDAYKLSKALKDGTRVLSNGKNAEVFGDWASETRLGHHMKNRNAQVMKRGLEAKFAPGTQEAEALQATGDAHLLEHKPAKGRDTIWSDNHDGSGLNLLGTFISDIRRGLPRTEPGPERDWAHTIRNEFNPALTG